MNINRINQIYQVSGNANIKKINKTEKTDATGDVLKISNEAKDFQAAFTEAMKAKDVRDELVNDVKQKMEKGEYEVNLDNLVDKIVDKKQ